MRALDPAFQAMLDTGATTLCHCWKIIRQDGVIVGFTDHDRPIKVDGVTFDPDGGADGAALSSSADLSIDNVEIAGAFRSDRLSAEDLRAGRYDGARVETYLADWRTPSLRVRMAVATLGETVEAGGRFQAELRGLAHDLSRTVGRVYQRDCDAIVGDARCGVDLSGSQYKGNGTVTAVIDESRFYASGLNSFETGWFSGGVVTWTAGGNAGLTAHVQSHAAPSTAGGTAARIALWLPAGQSISIGDGFDVTAGCARNSDTCVQKFNNLINFRGFHLMPGNDVAVSYPSKADENDGGKR
ncbi:MAG: DUF2163 domain-containing protein [Pseudomonadota bacterium]